MKKLLTRQFLGLVVLLAGLLPAGHALGQAPTWSWAADPGRGFCFNTVVDAAGNMYVAGAFYDTIRFGTTTLISTSPGNIYIYIAKLTSSGACVWAVSATGTGSFEIAYGVAVDSIGNVYVTGYLGENDVSFGGTTLAGTNRGNTAYVAKLNAAGAWQWAVGVRATSTGLGHAFGSALDLDAQGNIYVGGRFYSPHVAFGTIILANSNAMQQSSEVFVAKLSPAGVWQWARRADSPEDDYLYGLVVDSAANVYICGAYEGPTATFGTTVLSNPSVTSTDGFIAKLTSAGAWQWALRAGGARNDDIRALAVDRAGTLYATGNFEDSVSIGSFSLQSTGITYQDAFVGQVTPAGTWQWVEQFRSLGGVDVRALAVDRGGNPYVLGAFGGDTLLLGAGQLTNIGLTGSDIFVAKLAPTGAYRWMVGAGGGGQRSEGGRGVAVDGQDNVYVDGTLNNPQITFGALMLTNTTNTSHFFVARLTPTGVGLSDVSTTPAFTLTPNPAHTTVQLTGAPAPTAALLDALGRMVRTVATPAGTASLDVRGLAPGVYTVRAGAAVCRLVIE